VATTANISESLGTTVIEESSLGTVAVEDSRGPSSGQRQLNCKVIIIVQCKSVSSLKTRYILTKRSY
jgi:hypothetical protein